MVGGGPKHVTRYDATVAGRLNLNHRARPRASFKCILYQHLMSASYQKAWREKIGRELPDFHEILSWDLFDGWERDRLPESAAAQELYHGRTCCMAPPSRAPWQSA